jgi:hypothetical protein
MKPDFRTYITYLIERTRNDKEAEMNLIKKNIAENNFNDSKELQDLKEAFLVLLTLIGDSLIILPYIVYKVNTF